MKKTVHSETLEKLLNELRNIMILRITLHLIILGLKLLPLFQDVTLLILLAAAVISLALSFYHPPEEEGASSKSSFLLIFGKLR